MSLPYPLGVFNEWGDMLLRQRVVTHYEVIGLEANEVNEYVTQKLRAAGTKKSLFHDSVLQDIAKHSGSSLSQIDKLVSEPLLKNWCHQKSTSN